MKMAGHYQNKIYSLKSSSDNWPRLAKCDMSKVPGYEDNEAMESLIGFLNHSPKPVQPQEHLFSAYSSDIEDINAGSYIHFNNYYVNNGNSFDLASGTFTTPVNGHYHFSFSANCGFSKARCLIYVEKNSDKIVHAFFTGGTYYNNGVGETDANIASSWMLSLNEGDTIRLYVEEGPIRTEHYLRRTFNVHLLQVT